jgi:hypothetical protein
MAWEPDTFTAGERRTAGLAIVQAQLIVDVLRATSTDPQAQDVLKQADDMLAMLYEDLYSSTSIEDYPPEPSAS